MPRARLEPTVGGMSEIVLAKGQSRIIQHRIGWNQYADDTMRLEFRSTGASIRVPNQITLDFEKHQFRFEYEIKAGEKTGEFVVTLVPAVGELIEIKVIVK